jgi:hypothetical protein
LEVDRGHAEVAVPELALDDVQGHAFAQELKRVRVAQLVGRSAPRSGRGHGRRAARRRSSASLG